MDRFARAEQLRSAQAAPSEGMEVLRKRYYRLKARWRSGVWDCPEGKLLATAILEHPPLEFGESATFATPRTIALHWDIRNACEVGAQNILVVGERGTGKEELAGLIARELGKKRITVNCAMLVESVADSQLFGVAGNTGIAGVPKEGSMGIVQNAHGQVLLLDEFFDAPPAVLPKLLRLLQQRTFSRVGGHEETLSDTVIVAASNRHPTRADLEAACENGSIRGDVVDRFSTVLEIPPLRERREELPILANTLLRKIWSAQPAGKRHFPFHQLSRETGEALQRLDHSWPGNLRDLDRLLREQGMLRRHECSDTGTLEIPQDDLELWLGGQRPRETRPSEPPLTAWTPEGMRELRASQLLEFLRWRSTSQGRTPAEVTATWVAEICREVLKVQNPSQKLKEALHKTASEIAEEVRALLR